MGGRVYVQFCSNNYLGLAGDPEVIEAARQATQKWGTGAGASRLVAGSLAIHQELESALAGFKGTEAALLFPSGFMANLAVLTTFAGERDLIVCDKLNHASLLDAARFSGGTVRTFPHRNSQRARELLARDTPVSDGRRFLVSDTVFSMDGDVALLPELHNAARESGALLMVDDAHGTGILGERGAGLAELQQAEGGVDVTIGTRSKALGSLGGFVAGPRAAIDTLINEARAFIYTTALPAACAAAALAALKIIVREPERRVRVRAVADRVRRELVGQGYDCGDSATPIIPVIMGSSTKALVASTFLRKRGLFVPAIRPPTVAPNGSRLRISLMATHSDSQIDKLLDALREFAANGPA
jgi:8-amino-7-oxononanoate synthase